MNGTSENASEPDPRYDLTEFCRVASNGQMAALAMQLAKQSKNLYKLSCLRGMDATLVERERRKRFGDG